MGASLTCVLFWLCTSTAAAQVCYSQPFGNPDLADPWGCTGACGRSNPHRGLDYPEPCGTPIPAIADGVVVMNTSSGCLGWLVVIAHPDGMFSGYNHMPSPSPLPVGASVARGQIVGVVGNEGSCSFGCHLHLTVDYTAEGNWSGWYADVQVDPYSWIESHRECRPDHDGDGSPEGTDCDDGNPHRRPGLAETCDAIDNDCDAAIDESLSRTCGSDVGACRVGRETCMAGQWGACVGGNAATDEACDTLDNDCDGEADEDRVCDDEDAATAALVLSTASHSDVDGDGHVDACARTPGGFECLLASSVAFERVVRGPAMADEAGWSERAFYTSVRMGDVDGDGRDDVCARDGEHVVCWGASAQGFTQSILTVPLGELSSESRTAELWLADVDGDGGADVCVRDVEGLRCQPREGRALSLDALSDEAGWADVTRHGSIRFGDVDGDGRDDVCARLATGLVCWRSRTAGFEPTPIAGPTWTDALGWNEPRYGSTIRLVDVDGDGRADACGRGPDGFRCSLSLGARFGAPTTGLAMQGAPWDERSVYATIRMGDVDGDGASDVCARTADGARCWLWEGDGFERELVGPALTDAAGWDEAARYGSIRLADVNGDRRADLCARGADGMRCWISDGTGFPRLWLSPSWSDAVGMADPALASSLTVAGSGGRPSSHALVGGWSCSIGTSRSTHGAWIFLALSIGTGLARRARRRPSSLAR